MPSACAALALHNGAHRLYRCSDSAEQCCRHLAVRGALVMAVEAVSEQEPVDIVVPISRTADFIRYHQRAWKHPERHAVWSAFGHAGDGNVHLCVVRDEPGSAETWQRELHENMEQGLCRSRIAYGGVASGEHGIGHFEAVRTSCGRRRRKILPCHERHQDRSRPATYH
ncbi:MAG: FAD-linked oxidase C-terminal domain-containing protein [Oscillibacter sp.]